MNPESGNVRLDGRGRVALPAGLRRRLGLNPGDDLVVTEETDGALRLQSRRVAARSLLGLAGPADHSTVEELRVQRGREATDEEADAQRAARRAAR